MSGDKYAIGVDLGATTSPFGLVSDAGEVLWKEDFETHPEDGPVVYVNRIIEWVVPLF